MSEKYMGIPTGRSDISISIHAKSNREMYLSLREESMRTDMLLSTKR